MEGTMTPGFNERRVSKRRRAAEYGIKAARVRPGREVEVIDLSAGGALIESSHRLLPGTAVDLYLTSDRRQIDPPRGRIVRSAVSRLRSALIRYRGAIAFDRNMPSLIDVEPRG
jgi:hypothetical protein